MPKNIFFSQSPAVAAPRRNRFFQKLCFSPKPSRKNGCKSRCNRLLQSPSGDGRRGAATAGLWEKSGISDDSTKNNQLFKTNVRQTKKLPTLPNNTVKTATLYLNAKRSDLKSGRHTMRQLKKSTDCRCRSLNFNDGSFNLYLLYKQSLFSI